MSDIRNIIKMRSKYLHGMVHKCIKKEQHVNNIQMAKTLSKRNAKLNFIKENVIHTQ
jgi:hypothetical protein